MSEREDACYDRALKALFGTAPTSPAGLLALLRYVREKEIVSIQDGGWADEFLERIECSCAGFLIPVPADRETKLLSMGEELKTLFKEWMIKRPIRIVEV